MQENCVETSKKRSLGKIFLTIIILLSIACLSFLRICFFYYAIHPMIYFPGVDHIGLNLYTNEQYLNYEYGKEFKKYISSYDFSNKGEIIYFYHRDNKINDNPIHGKMSDIFAIDIKLNHDNYLIAKEELITYNYYIASLPTKKFILYIPIDLSKNNFERAFALNETECIIRLILITETENVIFSDSISGKINDKSSLSFD